MSNLSNLPPECLQAIAKRLEKFEDFVSFKCVSRSFFAALNDESFEGQRTPYLMLPVNGDNVRVLHSLVQGQSTRASIKVPNLKSKKCLESLGWLLIIGGDVGDDHNMSLLDPFSGTEILLPHLENDTLMSACEYINKMVLSASPSETSDFLLIILYAENGRLGFWRLGDETWKYIDCVSKGVNCTDVVYAGVGELFYAVGYPPAVWAFNLAKDEGHLITRCRQVSPRISTSILYILKTVDALLFITREVPIIRDEDMVCCMNTEFRVYKVNIEMGEYEQIDSLGSMAVFLGQSSSTIAVDASGNGVIKPNHIYFTDDADFIVNSKGMDVGMYNMQTKTVEPIYMGEPMLSRTFYMGEPMLSRTSLSLWITPGKPKLPPNFEETAWATLKSAIVGIFLQQPDPCDLEKLYQAVCNLFIHKMGGSLYQRIEQECEAHISAALQSLVGQNDDLVVFLSLVEKCWQDFCEQMLMIHRIALGIACVLDRTCVRQTPNFRSLWDMGLHLFRKHLALASEVESNTVFGLLKLIDSERLGEAVDRTLLNHLLKMFSALGIYTESFEKPFLERTSEFYAAEGAKFMHQSDIPDYLKHVELRLHEEHERCLLYLNAVTRRPLLATVEMQLFVRHVVAAILEKGFTMLMDGDRTEDLQRMYTLFLRLNDLEQLKQAFSSYILKTGQGIVMDEEKDKDMVSSLLEFMSSVDKIWEKSFRMNEAFSYTIVEAYEYLIDTLQENRLIELLAKTLNEKLLAGNKEELEDTLHYALILLRFIQGKDVFEAFYRKDLAKRLLLGKSASIDAEKSMISKLKIEYGSQFTNKLEGMFEDFELSKEINESFKQSSQATTKLPPGIEMSVHVLTTRISCSYWPTHPPMDVKIPHELNMYQDIFKEFYLSKHRDRRLTWQNSLGQCVLKAEFPKGNKELVVSLFQTVVLMLFNDAFKLSFQDIKESTGIEDKELRRTLQSLACGKVCVLQKIPKGKEVEDNDTFEFNDQFTAPLHRIKLNAIQMKETVEENTSTTERAFQDRPYQLDAAIVLIMKTRKVLSHTLLITELSQQLKFPIKNADVKKRIESLMDRDYLERDKNDSQIYNYLA